MNQIIEQNKNAVERMIEHRRKQIDDLVGSLIVFFLEENLPFYDAYYVCQRAFEILQKTTDKASFESEEIKKLRKALLKKKINEVRRDLWGFAKELEELRALPDIKPEEAQRIQQLEHIIKKEPQNETEERDIRCEKSARELVKTLLNEKLLMDNQEFIDFAVKEDDRLLLVLQFKGFYDALASKLEMVISRHEQRCNEYLWGKEREAITFKDLDLTLKKLEDEKKTIGPDSDTKHVGNNTDNVGK